MTLWSSRSLLSQDRRTSTLAPPEPLYHASREHATELTDHAGACPFQSQCYRWRRRVDFRSLTIGVCNGRSQHVLGWLGQHNSHSIPGTASNVMRLRADGWSGSRRNLLVPVDYGAVLAQPSRRPKLLEALAAILGATFHPICLLTQDRHLMHKSTAIS
jgi:hypothetical protein